MYLMAGETIFQTKVYLQVFNAIAVSLQDLRETYPIRQYLIFSNALILENDI